jgi:large subunit ribosomal protein L10
MNKAEKRQKAEALRQELEASRTVILSGFEGITVAQDFDLRRRIAQVGAKYKVVKNSLLERASQGTPLEPAARELSGTTSLAYTQRDPVALTRVLTAYAKENPLLKFKSGVVEGRVVSMTDLNMVANLPAKEELLSKALFLVKAPARNVALALAGVGRKLAVVVQQAVKEKKFSEGENDRTASDAFRVLKGDLSRKLGIGRGAQAREEAARSLSREPTGDPCDLMHALGSLGLTGVIPRGSQTQGPAPQVYEQLSESEKQRLVEWYRTECGKLNAEFPQFFKQAG